MKDQKIRRSFHLSGFFLLFHRNGFCQVSRLIHITATSHCHIVSKQLQRNDCQGIGKVRIRLGNVYHIILSLIHICWIQVWDLRLSFSSWVSACWGCRRLPGGLPDSQSWCWGIRSVRRTGSCLLYTSESQPAVSSDKAILISVLHRVPTSSWWSSRNVSNICAAFIWDVYKRQVPYSLAPSVVSHTA